MLNYSNPSSSVVTLVVMVVPVSVGREGFQRRVEEIILLIITHTILVKFSKLYLIIKEESFLNYPKVSTAPNLNEKRTTGDSRTWLEPGGRSRGSGNTCWPKDVANFTIRTDRVCHERKSTEDWTRDSKVDTSDRPRHRKGRCGGTSIPVKRKVFPLFSKKD